MLCPKEDAFLPPGAHRGVHPGPSKTLKMSWRPHLPFKTGQTKHAQHQNKPTGGCERASWVNFECLQRPGAQTGVPWGPTHTTPPTCAVVSEPRTKTHPRVENPDYGVCLRDWTVLFLPVRRIEAGRAFPDWVFHFWSLTHGGVVVPKTAPKTNPRKEIGFWYMDACLTQFPPHQFAEFSQRGHSPIGCLISGVCQKLARERSIELLKGCESRAQVNIEHGRHNAPAHVNGRPRERACFVLAPEWQKLQDLAVFKMRCSTPLFKK